ncbi:MAG: tetratricopeptide repeat protein [Candidatus Deferrimicrobiaceae bacterium]
MFMMIEVPSGRVRSSPAMILFFFLVFLLGLPVRSGADNLFAGYAPEVRTQALRVVDAAGPGKEEELAIEVRGLRKKMYSHGILSVNAIPELVFRRADREGWKKGLGSAFRLIAEISPLSAPVWAWMVMEDIRSLQFSNLFPDLAGLSGAVWQFAPARLGYAAWLVSFALAAACWFVVWTSIALFLRARPALELDILRFLRLPYQDYLSPLAVVVLFLLPLFAGFGLAVVACYWMVLSVAYLRRGELLLMAIAILLIAGIFFGGSMLHLASGVAGGPPGEGYLGVDGSIPRAWPSESGKGQAPGSGAAPSWLVLFSRARAKMQAGDHAGAERLWTELIEAGQDLPEVRNNRGITRAKQGRMRAALSDFEATFMKRPGEGAALWNAYQGYLQMFNLERARMIQPQAWDRVQKISPFHFRPSDMEAGEWVGSPLPVDELVRTTLQRGHDLYREAGAGQFYRIFFRPLSPGVALLFLFAVWLTSVIWKFFSLRVWVHTACRGCGTRTLIVGIRESTDFCNMCRMQVGWGVRAGEEKERRIQGIRMHRNTVRAGSVVVPGSGGLWSGKEGWTMLYVVLLCLSLAAVSVSIDARSEGDILSDLESVVARWAFLVTGVLWIVGAAWGIRSFGRMQQTLKISGKRG